MDSSQTLSPKPSIDEALLFLGMSNMEKAMAIQALLRISELDDLPLFFDEHLTCVPTSIKYGDQYDENNEFVEFLFVNPKDERELISGQTLDSFHLYQSTDNNFYILVSRLIHDDIEYCISRGDGTISEYIDIDYEKFYFDREELIKYKNEYSTHFSQKPNSNTNHSKKASLPEQRTAAFKYWLIANSGKSIHSVADLQSCYEDLGEPTRDIIWDRLKIMDSKLFSCGKDDFQKAISKVIQLKVGTGNGRDS